MSAWKKKQTKISSSFSPPHSNFCLLLHLCLVKWFPVTNCGNCQTQTLHFCSFLPPSLPARSLGCPAGEAQPAQPHRWTQNCPPHSTTILQHLSTHHWDPRTTLLATPSCFIMYFRLEKAKLSISWLWLFIWAHSPFFCKSNSTAILQGVVCLL